MFLTEFEWDESKRLSNIDKHGIDFEDAIEVFLSPLIVAARSMGDEERHIAVGTAAGHVIAVVYTMRSGRCRVISARKARTNERKAYHAQVLGRHSSGTNGLEQG
ncbi:conserved hypothetical protein [Magnetospirillum sp. LM-5]|uniref:BrnT family toxin n=1 Tax=Magnetospirillum sp. LM-5 TaxID=2681466 RepID=UPI0013837245|nr:BrnT family toxin [Magnetospirillum sp. LM-5]CAA7621352.1 conserved hypothetical protein [Magnetospirillum sp. LM-5]